MTKMSPIEERIERLERDVKTIAEVVAAMADDTLRVCFVVQEMADAGYLPEPPWELSTAMVELQHARRAQQAGEIPRDGTPIELRITTLEAQVRDLRERFRQRAHEQVVAG